MKVGGYFSPKAGKFGTVPSGRAQRRNDGMRFGTERQQRSVFNETARRYFERTRSQDIRMKIHDLTHPFCLGTKGYPGCARIVGWPMREISRGNYNMLHISTDLHTGTHVDAMRHCLPDGMDVASLVLEHCVGPAVVVDLRRKGAKGSEFEPDDFLPWETEIRRTGKVLVKTGWARTWGTPGYYEQFPGFSREAAHYLRDLGIHLVGMEQASVHPTDHLEIHRIFFERNVIIVEGLADLASVPLTEVEFFAAPLRFEGGDGSPVRAFCRYKQAGLSLSDSTA
jgi:arylformamidase